LLVFQRPDASHTASSSAGSGRCLALMIPDGAAKSTRGELL
jgi:hypothetical protein